MFVTLKQATGLLMKCNHDFRLMLAQMLCVKDGKIVLRDLVRQAYKPPPVNINQNSSKIFQEQTAKFPDFVDTADPESSIMVVSGFAALEQSDDEQEHLTEQAQTKIQWSQAYVQEEPQNESPDARQSSPEARPQMNLSSSGSESTPF